VDAHPQGPRSEAYARWTTVWTWCVRLSCAPPVLGVPLLLATRGTTNPIPSAAVFLACWVGLALALSGLFGLVAIRARQAEEHVPWSRSTTWFGIVGIVASLLVGSAAVLVLSTIEIR